MISSHRSPFYQAITHATPPIHSITRHQPVHVDGTIANGISGNLIGLCSCNYGDDHCKAGASICAKSASAAVAAPTQLACKHGCPATNQNPANEMTSVTCPCVRLFIAGDIVLMELVDTVNCLPIRGRKTFVRVFRCSLCCVVLYFLIADGGYLGKAFDFALKYVHFGRMSRWSAPECINQGYVHVLYVEVGWDGPRTSEGSSDN